MTQPVDPKASKGGSTGGGNPQHAQAMLKELRDQGITNLDELMQQVISKTPPDVMTQPAAKAFCNRNYCLVVRDLTL